MVAHFAREKNSWRRTSKEFLADVKLSCVEYGHGGLWNRKYSREGMITIDIAASYPVGFLGYGECSEYFKRFGHPTHEMTHIAINGPLPDFDLTGFAHVISFELRRGLHPCSYIWIGRHISEKHWMPIVLLRYMVDSGMLLSLIVGEARLCY